MAEPKAKTKASGKPASTAAETTIKTKTKIAKPAADKSAAKAKMAAPAGKTPTAEYSMRAPMLPVSAEQRYRMIAEAAYYIAERRNFAPGDAAADWAQAEMQIVALLKK